MARGELSFVQVRALTRVATPENEGELLAFARESTAAQLERVVRGWRLLNRKDEAEMESVRHRSRRLSVFPGDDGMYVVRGRLDPEVGALLMRAIEAAGDALFRSDAAGDTPPEQRRADALGLLAERALAVGFGGTGEDRCKASDPSIPVPIPIPASVPVSGSRAERYHVVLHVEPGTLESDVEPGCSELEDGTRVSAETSRRLSCDASVVEVAHAPDGAVLDVGRRTRTVPPSIRRALEARDRGCRFPGCGLRFTDAHHIRHWADGGVTRLDNLILACRHHHRLLHEGGYRVELNAWPGGRPVFYDPRGLPVPEAPSRIRLPAEPVEDLLRQNRLRGVRPDWRTAGARWKREDDVPIRVLTGVLRALDEEEERGRGPGGAMTCTCM